MLSPCERLVCLFLVRGFSSKLLAREIGISYQTVRKHRENIFRKLEVHSVAELASRLMGMSQG
ncbi:MAG: LuxR C-terminal-related transcriptional regulator [Burkholderiaceae bacterium]|nr:LuxR C-terminal-related transcriptional regulator [Burkholderiaceae bacterium]